jgi:heterodisulfide reductase subunit A
VDWAEVLTSSGGKKSVAWVNPAECKGCGLCTASCVSGAIRLAGFTDEQIFAMIGSQR